MTNGLAAAQRLRDLGLRYRLNIFPGDHFTPGLLNDYTIGAQYLKGAQGVTDPGEVRFSRPPWTALHHLPRAQSASP